MASAERTTPALWLCLHAPNLLLDAVCAELAQPDMPFVLLEPQAQRALVLAASQNAQAAGIRAGQTLAQARARLADVRALPRATSTEQALLETLACVAYQHSHQVHPDGQGMLLEIGASLQLFGGLSALLQKISQALQTLALAISVGLAPNPAAAALLARITRVGHVCIAKRFPQRLHPIAIAHSDMPADICEALANVGVQTLGQLIAIPRANLLRRYGKRSVAVLQALLGERTVLPPAWHPPAHFQQTQEFAFHVDSTTPLRFVLKRMLQALASYLQARDNSVQQMTLRLLHRDIPETTLSIGLLQPCRDATLMTHLAEQKLEQLQLAAAVTAIALHAVPLPALPCTADLFDPAAHASLPLPHLLERLQGKLGAAAIRMLACKADHRPEHASVDAALSERSQLPRPTQLPSNLPERPIWTQSPERIQPEQFRVLSGPERIESGWWNSDCRRDYYRVQHRDGRLLWVFQDHAERDAPWFLQGGD